MVMMRKSSDDADIDDEDDHDDHDHDQYDCDNIALQVGCYCHVLCNSKQMGPLLTDAF